MDASIWKLAPDEREYGERAGWYLLTSPDGEVEHSPPFKTEDEVVKYAIAQGWRIVPLDIE